VCVRACVCVRVRVRVPRGGELALETDRKVPAQRDWDILKL
jgi:hypothetical protein